MRYIFLFILLFINYELISQNIETQLRERGEAYVSFNISDVISKQIDFSALSFDKITDDKVYFYLSLDNYENTLTKDVNYRLEEIPSKLNKIEMASSLEAFSYFWDKYPTYQQYDSLMHKFQTNFPNLCKLENIGTLASGREILAVKLGDNVNTDENEVKFFYTSTMHGDEVTGYVMMLRLIDYLLTNYSSDSEVQYLMNNVEIWINPLANPDGTYHSGNNTVFGATRYNANAVDLNRNYPDPEDGPHPDGKVYQPETVFFMNLADSVKFNISANFHGGQEVVNYPWDTWSKLSADDDWWKIVSKRFADTAQANSPSGYMEMFGTGYTNGYQWYSVWGGRQDYMNYYQHCREVTIEISNNKTISESLLDAHWGYLKPSLLNYISDATHGITGHITDSITGFAVKSKIEILNHDIDSSCVYSNDSAFYFRPINTGVYDIKYSADGYFPKIIHNVHLYIDSLVNLDVELVSGYDAINDYSGMIKLSVFPNPINSDALFIKSNISFDYIEIVDLLGKQFYNEKVNSKLLKLNIRNYPKGVYIVRVSLKDGVISKKLIIQ